MSAIGNRAAILTLSRLASYGLMLVSPIVLVRLLSVEEFGRYREFLLYASILQSFAVFSINDSLLYCIPANPESPWRTARQTAVLTAISSALVVLFVVTLDALTGGGLVNGYRLPLAAYTLLSVNLDFWEYFWLARGRPGAVFVYSASRLTVRIAVAIIAAASTHDVRTIIWSLVALEGVRLAGAAVAMYLRDQSRREPPLAEPWRDQLRFCVPSGLASLLAMLSRNLSNVVVARTLGAAALAQYAIGRFGEPVVVTVRNSVSSVVLPEMVRRDRQERGDALVLWQRATVVNAILLLPVVVLVGRYAEPLVVTVFGPSYREAAVVLQLYLLVVIRECFDFAPALRAINRTRPLVESNVVALSVCGLGLWVFIPLAGVAGAMAAFVLGSLADVLYLGWRTTRLYGEGARRVVPWSGLARTALAALLAATLIATSVWTDVLGLLPGIAAAALTYAVVFGALLLMLRVPEALVLVDWARKLLSKRVFRRASHAAR